MTTLQELPFEKLLFRTCRNYGRVIVPLNEPFWKAPTLVTTGGPARVIVPLAEDESPGVLKWYAVAVAAPVELPIAELVPAVGAATLAEVVLCALALVPLNARPLLTTPAVDAVPTWELLLTATLPTVPPLPIPTPKSLLRKVAIRFMKRRCRQALSSLMI